MDSPRCRALPALALAAILGAAAPAEPAGQAAEQPDFAALEARESAANAQPGPRTVPERAIPVPGDVFLSNTVRTNRKLRQAGVETELQVFEGMSHARYQLAPDSPEAREAFEETARLLDKHLGR